MGDVLTLIEKAQENFDAKKAMELEQKLRSQQFTLDDFLAQMQELKKMGPISQILGMMPGMNSKMLENVDIDEKKMTHIEAIICSMTKEERRNPAIINGSRRKRIALGSGTSIQEVNRLLKDFEQMRKLMKSLNEMGKGKKRLGLKGFKMPF